MKKCISVLLFLVCISLAAFPQKDEEIIHASIVKFFDGLSAIDAGKLKEYATADFLLLEHGEVWNMDTLVRKISVPRRSNVTRVNTFRFMKTEEIGNIAWVSYYNTAELSFDDKQETIRWLESAVLRKENGTWKIQLLHSTRLK
jgi:hypothetical protein